MRKYNQLFILALSVFATAAVQSCKKSNGIDNNSVIKKPYGLYVGANKGELLNTNDGVNFKTLFFPDNYPFRSIVTAGPNILFVKANAHLSQNNGMNFNPTYKNYVPPGLVAPWQPVMYYSASHGRVYLASTDPLNKGIVFSDDNGKTWKPDTWDTAAIGTGITSFTQLNNGVMFSFGDANDSLYMKDGASDNWSHYPQTKPLPQGMSYLSHFNNTLILSDYMGTEGCQYSNDSGKTWTRYQGLPATNKLLCTHAPSGRVLLVGMDSLGVYRLENGSFKPSNTGLETNTSVYAIIGKQDVYKNGIEKFYIYIATSKGLYRSEDLGFSWALMLEGDFGAVY